LAAFFAGHAQSFEQYLLVASAAVDSTFSPETLFSRGVQLQATLIPFRKSMA